MNFASECDEAINLEDIISKINNNFAKSLRDSLTPLVDRMNSIDRSYRAISETLRKVPEFRDLVSENQELKRELTEFKSSYVEYPSVTLNVTEKARVNEDTNTIVEQVYTDVNLPPYGRTAGTLVSSDGLYDTDDDTDDDSSAGDDDDDDDDAVEADFIAFNGATDGDDDDNDDNDAADDNISSTDAGSSVGSVNDGDNKNSSAGDDTNEEVYLIEIHNKGTFYTDDEVNGIIYNIEDDDEIGEKVGIFKDGIEVFD
jgi:hypothetical protein